MYAKIPFELIHCIQHQKKKQTKGRKALLIKCGEGKRI